MRVKAKQITYILILFSLLISIINPLSVVKAAETGVTLANISDKYRGDQVTIAGTSTFQDVVVKVFDASNLILYIDTISVSKGSYSKSFTLATDAPYGTYKVIVGQDTTIATDEFVVKARESNNGGGSGGSGGSTPPSPPVKEEITVPIETGEVGSGTPISNTPISRTTESNGRITDEVELTGERAAETVGKLKEQGLTNARIIIPDAKDEVAEVKVAVPKVAVDALKNENINLEIFTPNVRLTIPNHSLVDFNKEFYFRIVPMKTEDERKQVEQRVKEEEIVREIAQDQNVEVYGRPMTIETNMESQRVDLVLPLKETLPTGEERDEFLQNLVIFIEHDDGTKEVIRGTIVPYDDNNLGIKFSIDKFSIFTIVYMENAGEALTPPSAPKVSIDVSNNKIIGIDETMEYQIDGGPWISFDPSKLPDLTGAQIVNVRVKAIGYKPAGSITTLTITTNASKGFHSPYIYGYKDGTFRPNAAVTRSQMAAMLARNLPADDTSSEKLIPYKDVASSNWAYSDIMKVRKAGVMLGVTDTQFNPEGIITRGQMAAIAHRWIKQECAKGKDLGSCDYLKVKQQSNFSDVKSTNWAYESIAFMKVSKIMVGSGDQTFKPNEPLTRAQAVRVLNQLFNRGPLTGVTTGTFSDVAPTHWAFNDIEESARAHNYVLNGETESIIKP